MSLSVFSLNLFQKSNRIPIAVGLAPDDLSSTLKQRLRWAQGAIQVLVRENPLTKAGLSFWQRLQYFQTIYGYFSGFATLVFIACPIIYFFNEGKN